MSQREQILRRGAPGVVGASEQAVGQFALLLVQGDEASFCGAAGAQAINYRPVRGCGPGP
jgi:hypothetical protein